MNDAPMVKKTINTLFVKYEVTVSKSTKYYLRHAIDGASTMTWGCSWTDVYPIGDFDAIRQQYKRIKRNDKIHAAIDAIEADFKENHSKYPLGYMQGNGAA